MMIEATLWWCWCLGAIAGHQRGERNGAVHENNRENARNTSLSRIPDGSASRSADLPLKVLVSMDFLEGHLRQDGSCARAPPSYPCGSLAQPRPVLECTHFEPATQTIDVCHQHTAIRSAPIDGAATARGRVQPSDASGRRGDDMPARRAARVVEGRRALAPSLRRPRRSAADHAEGNARQRGSTLGVLAAAERATYNAVPEHAAYGAASEWAAHGSRAIAHCSPLGSRAELHTHLGRAVPPYPLRKASPKTPASVRLDHAGTTTATWSPLGCRCSAWSKRRGRAARAAAPGRPRFTCRPSSSSASAAPGLTRITPPLP